MIVVRSRPVQCCHTVWSKNRIDQTRAYAVSPWYDRPALQVSTAQCASEVSAPDNRRSLCSLKHKQLPFRIKHPGDAFFFEGDASAVTTLADVDNKFVMDCVQLIREVSNVLREVHSGAAL